ncbi:hypothetical protein MJO10_30095, partial [Salmonella enterica subsp. enterica serovar Anatum]|nr:hypothetical protein [Salmonella enterica subsp. enterica serovar Anatum]
SELLVERLGVQFLAVGDDFRFGASRAGDFLLLQKAGAEYGFAMKAAVSTIRTLPSLSYVRYVMLACVSHWMILAWVTRGCASYS